MNPSKQKHPAPAVMGRESTIEEIWECFEEKSVYMNDVRRIGKTKILEKMASDGRPGWIVVHRDLEGHSTAAEFATAVYEMAHKSLTGGRQALRTMGKLLGQMAGTEIAGVLKLPDTTTAPWKDVLRRTFADVSEALANEDKRFVFLWDEVPFMLGNIEDNEGAKVAMEVLDVIRELTQTHERIRVLLTGSVGLHHVLSALQRQGYRGSPLNHMDRVAPGPLNPDEGKALALKLMDQFSVSAAENTNTDSLATFASGIVGHVPFYLRGLISKLRKKQVSREEAQAELVLQITNIDDPWDLSHYATRLKDFYGDDEPIAFAILDVLASDSAGLDFEKIATGSRTKTTCDDDQIRAVIKLLLRDHYLSKNVHGIHSFRLEVVRHWWCFERNITETSK